MANYAFGSCEKCDESTALAPLHYENGGPLVCGRCAATFHATHARRQRAGRIVIKAMELYQRHGGAWTDLEKLRLCAGGLGREWARDIVGYAVEPLAAEVGDFSSELLDDALQLTHPDRHPAERQALAQRVTGALLALRPFTFPAPKPEPEPESPPDAPPRDGSAKVPDGDTGKPSRTTYPCESCTDEAPYFYCDPCKREWDRRQEADLERERAKQRTQRARRRARRLARTPPVTCPGCGQAFTPTRKDKRHCSPTCRQTALRQRRNGLKLSPPGNDFKPSLEQLR